MNAPLDSLFPGVPGGHGRPSVPADAGAAPAANHATGVDPQDAVLLAALRPRAGTYVLGGVDTSRLTGDGVRARTAWLPQDAHVFASSIRANLSLAAPRGALRERLVG